MRYTINKDTQYDFVGKYDTNIEEFANNDKLRIGVMNKLGQYEDIEEDLKCPLDFCITPYHLTGLKKIWYRKQWCDVVRIVIYEEATRPYMEVRVKELKNLKIVFLDNYGETWFLTNEEVL